jgi:hypothetical protein
MPTPTTITIDDVRYVREDSVPATPKFGPETLVRTRSAGVHIGELESVEGTSVVLRNARRLWKWGGAFTLNAVAARGVTRAESRISVAVPKITLTEAIELIPVVVGVDLSPTEA